tara:strand:+ start:304 stop:600 length:297 start_codon:yes stop_codon:yes gene_type:complete
MRVRISYSVDLEDVPEECARMLQDSLEHVGELHTQIEDLIDQLDKGQCVSWVAKLKIAECRERLGKLDAILGDNDMILEGYYTAKEPKEEVEDVSDQG